GCAIVVLLSVVCGALVFAQSPEAPKIDRLDPALDSIVSTDAKITVVPTPPGANEGPVWIRRGNYLLFTNLTTRNINKLDLATGQVTVNLEHRDSNGVRLDRRGRVIWMAHPESMDASPAGTVVRLEKDGSRTILAKEFDGKPLNAPNDVVTKSDG